MTKDREIGLLVSLFFDKYIIMSQNIKKYETGGRTAVKPKLGSITYDGKKYEATDDIKNQLRNHIESSDNEGVRNQYGYIEKALNDGKNIKYDSAINTLNLINDDGSLSQVEFGLNEKQKNRSSKKRSGTGKLISSIFRGEAANTSFAVNELRSLDLKETPKQKTIQDWSKSIGIKYDIKDGNRGPILNDINSSSAFSRLSKLGEIESYSDDDEFRGFNGKSKKEYVEYVNSIKPEVEGLKERLKSGKITTQDAAILESLGIVDGSKESIDEAKEGITEKNEVAKIESDNKKQEDETNILKEQIDSNFTPNFTFNTKWIKDNNLPKYNISGFEDYWAGKGRGETWKEAILTENFHSQNKGFENLMNYYIDDKGNAYSPEQYSDINSKVYKTILSKGYQNKFKNNIFDSKDNGYLEALWAPNPYKKYDRTKEYNPFLEAFFPDHSPLFTQSTNLYNLPDDTVAYDVIDENTNRDFWGLPIKPTTNFYDKNMNQILDEDVLSTKPYYRNTTTSNNDIKDYTKQRVESTNPSVNGLVVVWDNGTNALMYNPDTKKQYIYNHVDEELQYLSNEMMTEAKSDGKFDAGDWKSTGIASDDFDWWGLFGKRFESAPQENIPHIPVGPLKYKGRPLSVLQTGGIIKKRNIIEDNIEAPEDLVIRDHGERSKDIFDGDLTTADKLDIASLIGDASALGISVVGGGNPVAAVAGLAASGTQFAADWNRDGLDWNDAGNLALNAGLDLATFVPFGVGSAASTMKVVKTIKKLARPIRAILLGIGANSAVEALDTENFGSIDNLRAIVTGLSVAMGGKRLLTDGRLTSKYKRDDNGDKILKTKVDSKSLDDRIMSKANTKLEDFNAKTNVEGSGRVDSKEKLNELYDKDIIEINGDNIKINKKKSINEIAKAFGISKLDIKKELAIDVSSGYKDRAIDRIISVFNPSDSKLYETESIFSKDTENPFKAWMQKRARDRMYGFEKYEDGGSIIRKNSNPIFKDEYFNNNDFFKKKYEYSDPIVKNEYPNEFLNIKKAKIDDSVKRIPLTTNKASATSGFGNSLSKINLPKIPLDMIYGMGEYIMTNKGIKDSNEKLREGVFDSMRGSMKSMPTEYYSTFNDFGIKRSYDDRIKGITDFVPVNSDERLNLIARSIKDAQKDALISERDSKYSELLSSFSARNLEEKRSYSGQRSEIADFNRNIIGQANAKEKQIDASEIGSNTMNFKSLISQLRTDNNADIMHEDNINLMADTIGLEDKFNNDYLNMVNSKQPEYSQWLSSLPEDDTRNQYSIERWFYETYPNEIRTLKDNYKNSSLKTQMNARTPRSWIPRKKYNFNSDFKINNYTPSVPEDIIIYN